MIKLSEINGAANLSNLASIRPSSFSDINVFKIFSTFSCEIHGIVNYVFPGIFSSQSSFNVSKLVDKGGSLMFDATDTKYF